MASSLIVETPLGPLRLVADGGALVSVWIDGEVDPEQGAFPFAPSVGAERRSRSACQESSEDPEPVLEEAREQLTAWFRGTLRTFDLPLRPRGTPFQQAVWRELRQIPFGETRTYGDIAAALGRPTACRAVGAANGRNPIAIVVPCHRVIGASGALTGYAGGLARKRWLLDHERAVLAR